jgi:hypothetical protein
MRNGLFQLMLAKECLGPADGRKRCSRLGAAAFSASTLDSDSRAEESALIGRVRRRGYVITMKSPTNLKKPFGTAKMVRIKAVRYLAWEDAFDVEFDDGLCFLEPHKTIRKANKISAGAEPLEVLLDEESRIGFEVRYDNRQVAEVSWAFVRELPPAK